MRLTGRRPISGWDYVMKPYRSLRHRILVALTAAGLLLAGPTARGAYALSPGHKFADHASYPLINSKVILSAIQEWPCQFPP